MCAYKLVTIKFKWWGLQNKVENFIQKVSRTSWRGREGAAGGRRGAQPHSAPCFPS